MHWVLGLLLYDLNAGLVVETGSPDALCPELARTRQIVSARLGTLESREGTGWRARYTIGHAPEGAPRDFVDLELFDAKGERKLERRLPMEESCATMSEVVALVLERYFRGLDDSEREAPAERAPAESPAPAEPSPVLDRAPPDRSASAPVLVAAQIGATSAYEGPAALLGVEVPLSRSAGVGLAAFWPFGERGEDLAAGGRAVATAFGLEGRFAWGPRFGWVRPYAGPSVAALLERGSTSGLPADNVQHRLLFAAGLDGGAVFFPGGSLIVLVSGSGHFVVPAAASFVVDDDEVLEPPRLFGYVGLGVGYAL